MKKKKKNISQTFDIIQWEVVLQWKWQKKKKCSNLTKSVTYEK